MTDIRLSRFDKFDVVGRDPQVKLSQRPIFGSISVTCEFGNEFYKVPFDVLPDYLTIALPGKYKKGSRISVRGEYSLPSTSSLVRDMNNLLQETIYNDVMAGYAKAKERDKQGRCLYCNCKLDSTQKHCTSCGAPC